MTIKNKNSKLKTYLKGDKVPTKNKTMFDMLQPIQRSKEELEKSLSSMDMSSYPSSPFDSPIAASIAPYNASYNKHTTNTPNTSNIASGYGTFAPNTHYPNYPGVFVNPSSVTVQDMTNNPWNPGNPIYTGNDSDNVDNIIPVDKDNDLKWNVARLTITGDPSKDSRLVQYLEAGWEPMSTMYVEQNTFILILKRLERM